MNTVVVTGGCGLIGQHICSGLLKKGFAVIAVDKEPGIYNEGKLNYSFVQAAPTDKDEYAEIFEKNEVSVLIHAACTVDNDLGPIITEKEMNFFVKPRHAYCLFLLIEVSYLQQLFLR